MEIDVKKTDYNPLMGRTEVEIQVGHSSEATPSKESIKSRFSAERNIDEENIEVEYVYTGYGVEKSASRLKIQQRLDIEETEEETVEEENKEDSEAPEETSETGEDIGYEELVKGTVSDVKDRVKEMEDPDIESIIEAEKENKDRKTMKKWLESR